MADVDTLAKDTATKRLQVANLAPSDAGRGVARLPIKLMTELGLTEGAVRVRLSRARARLRCAISDNDFSSL